MTITMDDFSLAMNVTVGSMDLQDLEDLDVVKCVTVMPSVTDFVAAMTLEIMALICVSGTLVCVNVFIFWRNFKQLYRTTPKRFVARTVILCGLYQVSGGGGDARESEGVGFPTKSQSWESLTLV